MPPTTVPARLVHLPMYDFAHGQSDSIEGVTHSLCDLAYEDHRPLYEWFLENLDIFRSRQIEFSRLIHGLYRSQQTVPQATG